MKLNKHPIFYIFILIEFFIGLTFLLPNNISSQFKFFLVQFMPIVFWIIIFIAGSIIGAITKKRLVYVCSVSVPIILYGSILFNGYFVGGIPSLTGFTTYFILGVGSALTFSYYGRDENLAL